MIGKIFGRIKGVGFILMILTVSVLGVLGVNREVFAKCPDGYVETSLMGSTTGTDGEKCAKAGNAGISNLLNLALKILVYAIGVLGTVGLVIAGIQYLTAGGNESQVTKAKNRIIQIVIGLIAYGLVTTVLNFLIPGGVF